MKWDKAGVTIYTIHVFIWMMAASISIVKALYIYRAINRKRDRDLGLSGISVKSLSDHQFYALVCLCIIYLLVL